MQRLFLLTLFTTAWLAASQLAAATLSLDSPPLSYPVHPAPISPYRLVDGIDDWKAPARPQPKAKVQGVPVPQAAPAPAPAPAPRPAPQAAYPCPVIVNVYNIQAPASDSWSPAIENAYYNPVAPVYYVSWPETLIRGRFYAWGVPFPYINPPYGVCHYQYEYGAVAKYRRAARTNIHYNYRQPCRLPR